MLYQSAQADVSHHPMGMYIYRKLRDLKNAGTRPNVPFSTGWRKSLNIDFMLSL
jgi:hypothetical protein